MTSSKLTDRIFTLRQANQMLPLVQSITTDIVELTDEVMETRERLDYLNDGRVGQSVADVYRTEVLSIEMNVLQKSVTIDDYVLELIELGLTSNRVTDGFVDFPAQRKNEAVCLCWKLGEPDVRHWHSAAEECEQRRPVDLELIRQSGDHAFV